MKLGEMILNMIK